GSDRQGRLRRYLAQASTVALFRLRQPGTGAQQVPYPGLCSGGAQRAVLQDAAGNRAACVADVTVTHAPLLTAGRSGYPSFSDRCIALAFPPFAVRELYPMHLSDLAYAKRPL